MCEGRLGSQEALGGRRNSPPPPTHKAQGLPLLAQELEKESASRVTDKNLGR